MKDTKNGNDGMKTLEKKRLLDRFFLEIFLQNEVCLFSEG
jgi:hypothetical protein